MKLRNRSKFGQVRRQRGSIELIVLGLLSALLVIGAVPVLTSMGQKTAETLTTLDAQVGGDIDGVTVELPDPDEELGPPEQAPAD